MKVSDHVLVKYAHYIFVVNRPDLLRQAIESVKSLWPYTHIVDNSPNGQIGAMGWPVPVIRPSVPLTCPQSMNFAQRLAMERGIDVWGFQHSDVVAPPGAAEKYLAAVQLHHASDRRWATLFTHYDWIAAFRTLAVDDIGPWDTQFPEPNYYFDIDWYHRARRAGYETIDTHIDIVHLDGGSNTRKEPDRQKAHDAKKGMNVAYYHRKWGGPAHQEKYADPWQMRPVKVLGLQRTGTNLIAHLLRNNFAVELLAEERTGWKHGQLQAGYWAKSASFVLCVKNPWAWLSSCYRYFVRDFGADTTIDPTFKPAMAFAEFLRAPSYEYANPVERYNCSYSGWLEALPADRTIIIRQEDQLDAAGQLTGLDRVREALKLKPIADPTAEIRRVDVDCQIKGDMDAARYRDREYMADYSPDDLAWVRERIDAGVLKRLGYE